MAKYYVDGGIAALVATKADNGAATGGGASDPYKMNTVPSAVLDDIATFTSTGNVKDSGKKLNDLATAVHDADHLLKTGAVVSIASAAAWNAWLNAIDDYHVVNARVQFTTIVNAMAAGVYDVEALRVGSNIRVSLRSDSDLWIGYGTGGYQKVFRGTAPEVYWWDVDSATWSGSAPASDWDIGLFVVCVQNAGSPDANPNVIIAGTTYNDNPDGDSHFVITGINSRDGLQYKFVADPGSATYRIHRIITAGDVVACNFTNEGTQNVQALAMIKGDTSTLVSGYIANQVTGDITELLGSYVQALNLTMYTTMVPNDDGHYYNEFILTTEQGVLGHSTLNVAQFIKVVSLRAPNYVHNVVYNDPADAIFLFNYLTPKVATDVTDISYQLNKMGHTDEATAIMCSGYSITQGKNVIGIYAPTPNSTILSLLLADGSLYSQTLNNAFLNTKIETIYTSEI